MFSDKRPDPPGHKPMTGNDTGNIRTSEVSRVRDREIGDVPDFHISAFKTSAVSNYGNNMKKTAF
jgi:hypothetical protein